MDIRLSYILIGINALIFVLETTKGDPRRISTAMKFGAVAPSNLEKGEYWRLLTAMFVHFGISHLICNLYALYVLGPDAEWILGRPMFLVIYFAAGIMGNLLTWFYDKKKNKNTVSAGASGAIMGLLGVFFVLALIPQMRGVLDVRGILLSVALNLFTGLFVKQINWVAHLGGFVTCAVLTAITMAVFYII